jgi:N-methylhydantoinase A/oxoprolinase/acetone carboxylase beta subunit
LREIDPSFSGLMARARPLIARAKRELIAEGAHPSAFVAQARVDMRYRGQSYELEVPLTRDFAKSFHALHRQTFGHSATDAAIEVVNLRLRASAADAPTPIAKLARQRGRPSPVARMRVLVGSRERSAPVYSRDALGAGARLRGPAIIVELSSTAYVAPEFTLRVDDYGNLHLEANR